ncbi:MAG TPA: low molecular weight protein-tyrosine-phosphatase [Streptosporangiaceae bacterium]|jgi:protein-tyrosine phosphatase
MSVPAAALPPPHQPGTPYTVCLVCLGNICRSPMAEVVLRAELAQAGLADAVTVDSAGTGDWHLGHPMDTRARAELEQRGYDGSAHRARQVDASWLPGRDLFLAMDRRNLADLRLMAAQAGVPADRVRLFGEASDLRASGGAGDYLDIPDPYGGGADDFSAALELIRAGARDLVTQLAVLLAGHAPA